MSKPFAGPLSPKFKTKKWVLSPRWRSLAILATASFLPSMFSSIFPTTSNAIEERLHWEPLQILRHTAGLSPEMNPRLKVVVVDDSTLSFLGRNPTFPDFLAIINKLADFGVKRVIINDFFDLTEDYRSQIELIKARIPIYTGVAVLPENAKTVRAVSLNSEPTNLFLDSKYAPQGVLRAVNGMASAPDVLLTTEKLGSMNSLGAYRAPAGFLTTNGYFLPHISLYAAEKIPELPSEFYVDFVSFFSVAKNIVPARRFYLTKNSFIDTSEKLKSVFNETDVVVLIPDGYTGSRTISSPSGLVPSYLATVSLANSAMNQRILKQVFNPLLLEWAMSIAAFITVISLSAPVALASMAAVVFIFFLASGISLIESSLLIPSMQISAPIVFAWSRLAWLHFHNTRREKTALRHELSTGSIVQKMFIPQKREGIVGSWRYKFLYEPYGDLSGDWMQVSWHSESVGLIAIGDVVGKGASASLLTASIAALWRDFCRNPNPNTTSIIEFIKKLGDFISETFQGEQNTTMSLALLLKDRAFVFTAGAPPWLKVSNRKSIIRVNSEANSPLGMPYEGEKINLAEVSLEAGDALIAFTDGVIDGGRARGKFTKNLTNSLIHVSDEDIFSVIEGSIRCLPHGSAMPDDFTLLMLEFLPDSKNLAA